MEFENAVLEMIGFGSLADYKNMHDVIQHPDLSSYEDAQSFYEDHQDDILSVLSESGWHDVDSLGWGCCQGSIATIEELLHWRTAYAVAHVCEQMAPGESLPFPIEDIDGVERIEAGELSKKFRSMLAGLGENTKITSVGALAVMLQHSLPEEYRKRLVVWTSFEPMDEFKDDDMVSWGWELKEE